MAARMRGDTGVKRRNRLTGCLRTPRNAHDVGVMAARVQAFAADVEQRNRYAEHMRAPRRVRDEMS